MPKIKYLNPTIKRRVLEMYAIPPVSKPIIKQATIIGRKPEQKSKMKKKVESIVSKVRFWCRPRKITFMQGKTRKTSIFKISSTENTNDIWYAYGTLDKQQVKLIVDPNQPHCEVIYL